MVGRLCERRPEQDCGRGWNTRVPSWSRDRLRMVRERRSDGGSIGAVCDTRFLIGPEESPRRRRLFPACAGRRLGREAPERLPPGHRGSRTRSFRIPPGARRSDPTAPVAGMSTYSCSLSKRRRRSWLRLVHDPHGPARPERRRSSTCLGRAASVRGSDVRMTRTRTSPRSRRRSGTARRSRDLSGCPRCRR
jgi:hypothetical protein